MTFNFFLNNLFNYRDRRLRGWQLVRGLLPFYPIWGLVLSRMSASPLTPFAPSRPGGWRARRRDRWLRMELRRLVSLHLDSLDSVLFPHQFAVARSCLARSGKGEIMVLLVHNEADETVQAPHRFQ